MASRFALALYSATLLLPVAALAQQPAARANPAPPDAAVPAVNYDSAFAGYTPYRDEKLASWRDVNDETARVGGHLGIFGGAAHGGQPSAKPAVKSQPSGGMPGMGHKR